MKLPNCLALLLAALLATAPAWAEASLPSLWYVVQEADLIVVAEVSGLEPWPDVSPDDGIVGVRLRVQETILGPHLDSVSVPHSYMVLCTAPSFYVGEVVVAFLELSSDRWRTVGRANGTLYPRGSDMDDVLAMTRAAVALQKDVTGDGIDPEVRRQWLLEAAARPGTRWQGLRELAPQLAGVRVDPEDPWYQLTAEERRFLMRAFVREPRPDRSFSYMLGLLSEVQDPTIDRVALSVIEGFLGLETPQFYLDEAVLATLARFGSSEADGRIRLESFRNSLDGSDDLGRSHWEWTADEWRRFWDQQKQLLNVPDVPPMDIDPERYDPPSHQGTLAEFDRLSREAQSSDGTSNTRSK